MENPETNGLPEAIKILLERGASGAEAGTRIFGVDFTEHGLDYHVNVAIVPEATGGMKVVSLLDAEKQAVAFAREQRLLEAPGPDRREGTAQLQSLDSFNAHANRFKSHASAVWANSKERQLVAVLDYHPEGALSPAAWGRHRGIYNCPLSDEWNAWGGGRAMQCGQDALAKFLDAHDRDLAEGALPGGLPAPTPAALVSMAANLETYSKSKAKSERDKNTGRRSIAFSNESGFEGTVAPPPSFLISIPVFQDGSPQLLEVRLGAEVEEGGAKFTLQIHAANKVLRDAFNALCMSVQASTGLPVFSGTPE